VHKIDANDVVVQFGDHIYRVVNFRLLIHRSTS
jgi:hypothetical protein